jgi:hypothetical protein
MADHSCGNPLANESCVPRFPAHLFASYVCGRGARASELQLTVARGRYEPFQAHVDQQVTVVRQVMRDVEP